MGDLVALPDLRLLEREPDAGLIEELEELLEAARRGEILSVAYVAETPEKYRTYWKAQRWGARFATLGLLVQLQGRIQREIEEDA